MADDVDEPRQEARRNTRSRFEQWARNPTCDANTLSAVHNVRLDAVAKQAGYEPTFGQSPFAISRGNRFEAGLFFDDALRLRKALERKAVLPPDSRGFLDLRLRMNGGSRIRSVDEALVETEAWLRRIASDPAGSETIVAGPMVRIPKGVILPEALLIIDAVTVLKVRGCASVSVGEVKVFADRGGHTNPRQLAAARAQAGIYRHALELSIAELGLAADVEVRSDGFLVFTWPGSNSPAVRPAEDLTFQAIRAERGFQRLEAVAQSLVRDDDFRADNPALVERVLHSETDYCEACLSFCDLAPRCHARALQAEDAVVLGDEVSRLLGDTTTTRAGELLDNAEPASEREADLQRQLLQRDTREPARKLRAWKVGRPLPRYATVHHAVVREADALVVTFVRMAGESRPWGIAWGQVGTDPRIESVPDGRIRDDVAALCSNFAEDLLAHMRVHNWTYDPVGQDAQPADLRQVWLPNGQHIAMLHHLDYAYSQTKFGGVDRELLRAFGRLCGWMFRDTSRRGHQHVVDASAVLRQAFVFPTQDSRSAHLGYQMGWLTAEGDRSRHLSSAEKAEAMTVSPTMDPRLERGQLEPLVDRYQAIRRSDDGTSEEVVADIHAVLRSELERRWKLTEAAYRQLRDDPRTVNRGVAQLIRESHLEFWFQHQRMELRQNDPSQGPAFVPHPETDFHGSAAASRYLIYAAADESYIGYLIHDDLELFREALDDGHALRGAVVAVRDFGSGRNTVPIWDLQVGPGAVLRMREGTRVTPFGFPGHEATIIAVDATGTGLSFTLEWTSRKTKALGHLNTKPADPRWIGETVEFVVSDASDLTRRRSSRVWKAKDGPGAWLTHGRAPARIEITTDDGDTELLTDDIRQIEQGATV